MAKYFAAFIMWISILIIAGLTVKACIDLNPWIAAAIAIPVLFVGYRCGQYIDSCD